MRFVAPELSAGPVMSPTNEASDVYSLAMTIYALGTGLLPFHETYSDYTASQMAKAGARPSRVLLGGLTQAENGNLLGLLTGMWEHEPASRPSVFAVRKDVVLYGLMPLSPGAPRDDWQVLANTHVPLALDLSLSLTLAHER